MSTTKIYHELQEIKHRLFAIEEHLLIDTKDPFLQAKQYQSQIIALLRIMRGRAPTITKETMIEEAGKKGVDREMTLQCLEILRRTGEIFEPKEGFIQRI